VQSEKSGSAPPVTSWRVRAAIRSPLIVVKGRTENSHACQRLGSVDIFFPTAALGKMMGTKSTRAADAPTAAAAARHLSKAGTA
jgi:hypothetical protein